MQYPPKLSSWRWIGDGLRGCVFRGAYGLNMFSRYNLNSNQYILDILEEYVMPLAPFIAEDFIFQQDNGRPHSPRIVQQYIQPVGLQVMQWSTRSPDLNPIEYVWDMVGRRLREHEPPPVTLEDVSNQLVQI